MQGFRDSRSLPGVGPFGAWRIAKLMDGLRAWSLQAASACYGLRSWGVNAFGRHQRWHMLVPRGRAFDREVSRPGRADVERLLLTMVLLEDSKRGEALRLIALVALCLFLFGFGLHSRVLWDVDEGMHAVMTKNILVNGDWITPTFNGENFYDKTILFNWLGALCFLLFGKCFRLLLHLTRCSKSLNVLTKKQQLIVTMSTE